MAPTATAAKKTKKITAENIVPAFDFYFEGGVCLGGLGTSFIYKNIINNKIVSYVKIQN
jgi:hypothetical protein